MLNPEEEVLKMYALFRVTLCCQLQFITLILILVLSRQLSAAGSTENLVRFDTADYGPSPVLEIDGVSIIASDNGRAATQNGMGLGMDLVGASWALDVVYGTPENGQAPVDLRDGWITLEVSGSIESLTLLPYSTTAKSGGLFAVLLSPDLPDFIQKVNLAPTDQTPVSINLLGWGNEISTLSVGVLSRPPLGRGRGPSGPPGSGAGFSIQSLLYRASAIPEPTALALASAGLYSLLLLRRRMYRAR